MWESVFTEMNVYVRSGAWDLLFWLGVWELKMIFLRSRHLFFLNIFCKGRNFQLLCCDSRLNRHSLKLTQILDLMIEFAKHCDLIFKLKQQNDIFEVKTFFVSRNFLSMSSDFKNRCKNEVQDNNEKLCCWSKNKLSCLVRLFWKS